MCRNGLRLARALEHKQLGEDSNSLQPDGERPKNFGELEAVVEDERKDDARPEEVFDAEGVNGGVVCGSAGADVRKHGYINQYDVRTAKQTNTHLYLNFMRYRM